MATDTKTNRYTILDAEIKRISKELKTKKQEMLKAIKDAEAAYRKYRKEVYAPARKAAFDVFKASKVVGVKKADKPAKKTTGKKVVVKKTEAAPAAEAKVTGTDKTAAECIAAGNAALEAAKAAAAKAIETPKAAKNPKAKAK